jgi:hypothetical protein
MVNAKHFDTALSENLITSTTFVSEALAETYILVNIIGFDDRFHK